MSQIKVQIAIQGGGAKVVALLAALEKVQELEKEGLIQVTCVAGTSAGAIVGCLFAAGIPLGEVKEQLRSIQTEDVSKAFAKPGGFLDWAHAFHRLWKGLPLWDTAPLFERLNKLLKTKNIISFADLKKSRGIDVKVVSADLIQCQKKGYTDEDLVVQAQRPDRRLLAGVGPLRLGRPAYFCRAYRELRRCPDSWSRERTSSHSRRNWVSDGGTSEQSFVSVIVAGVGPLAQTTSLFRHYLPLAENPLYAVSTGKLTPSLFPQ